MITRRFGPCLCALMTAAFLCASGAFGHLTTASAQEPAKEATKQAPRAKAEKKPVNWEERTEQRIAELQAQLLITAEQQKAFDDLAQVMRDNAKTTRAAFEKWYKEAGKLSALESLKAHAAMSQERAQAMTRLIAVFEPLYTKLSDDQKKVADAVFSSHERRGLKRSAGEKR